MLRPQLAAITVAVTLTAQTANEPRTLPAASQPSTVEDLGIGGGIGQTVSSDGRYTSATSLGADFTSWISQPGRQGLSWT
jgi:hypothetical protein